MEFSRQEYWSGLPFPPPEDLPDPENELGSPALQANSLLSEPPGKLKKELNQLAYYQSLTDQGKRKYSTASFSLLCEEGKCPISEHPRYCVQAKRGKKKQLRSIKFTVQQYKHTK